MRSPAPGPPARNRDAAAGRSALLADFSLDITSKELSELMPARTVIPAGTPVQLAFPDGADLAERVSTAAAIKEAGFTPVPIIAARRLRSQQMLREYLAALQGAGASESVLVVAGDPGQPQGPYPDAASVIGSGLLEERGVRQASIAGHLGGHPAVADSALWAALTAKTTALGRRGLGGDVITQFGFDATQVLAWLTEVRARGLGLPVRVSVPGPANVRRLLAIASRCGVAVSASVAEEYGFSLTEPTRTAGPDWFVHTLASGYDPRLHGEVKLHFNAFGGFSATVEWISRFQGRQAAAAEELRLVRILREQDPMTSDTGSPAEPTRAGSVCPGGSGLIAGRTVARVGHCPMQLRNLRHDRDAASALLRRALELGVSHVDTAQFYGDGLVSELIREAVDPDDGVTVVSNVGADPALTDAPLLDLVGDVADAGQLEIEGAVADPAADLHAAAGGQGA